jgi:MFS transporter, DHA1 family, tetracycline resistance protein
MYAAGALALANALLALRLLPESLPPERRSAAGSPASALSRLRAVTAGSLPAGLRPVFLASFVVTLAFAGTEATLALWAHQRLGFGPAGVALLFSYLGVVSALAQGGLAGAAARRWGERPVALVGIALLAAGFLALPATASLGLSAVALALGLLAAGQGTASPTLAAMVSRAAGADAQGSLLGISQSLGALARIAGPLGGGAAFAYLASSAPYLGGALLAAAGLATLALAGSVP